MPEVPGMQGGRVPPLVLFDLDGTLLDSAPDMLATVNRMRQSRGMGPMALAELRPVVSKGARAMSAIAFPDLAAEKLPELVPEFLEIYRTVLWDLGYKDEAKELGFSK